MHEIKPIISLIHNKMLKEFALKNLFLSQRHNKVYGLPYPFTLVGVIIIINAYDT